ncbi:MAG: outer membrane protein assembly factor BamD [Gemmatimonadetes bacterium]|nr:MAG: outer membrane protein assembly factor BamD [Gemmatimonadota bacterium]
MNHKLLFVLSQVVLLGVLFSCTSTTPTRPSDMPDRQYLEMEAELVFDEALKNYRENRLQLAIENFEDLIRSYPNSRKRAESYYLMGDAQYRLRQYPQAIHTLNTLITTYPQNEFSTKALLLIAQTYFSGEDYLQAAAFSIRFLDRVQDNPLAQEAHQLLEELVYSYLTVGELDQLAETYQQATVRDKLLYVLARRYSQKNEFSKARRVLIDLLQHYPDSAYYVAARTLYEQIRISGGYDLSEIRRTEQDSSYHRPVLPAKALSIGLICPLTGRYAVYGQAVQAGIKLAIKKFESREGIQINLVTRDSQADPIVALQAVNQLIEAEEVVAILGPVMSDPTVVVAGVAQGHHIPLITPTATDRDISSIGSYIFRLNATTATQGVEMADYAVNELGYRKFGLLYSTNPGAIQLARSFENRVLQYGGFIVSDQQFVEGTTDFREQMEALKAAEPEAIYIPATPAEAVLIAPQLAYHHIDAQILGSEGWGDESVIRLGERYVNHAIFTAQFYSSTDSPVGTQFQSTFQYEYGYKPDRTAALGYDAVNLILSCVAQGNTTPTAIQQCLARTRDYEGASGKITFLESGDAKRDVVLLTIIDGNFVEVHD